MRPAQHPAARGVECVGTGDAADRVRRLPGAPARPGHRVHPAPLRPGSTVDATIGRVPRPALCRGPCRATRRTAGRDHAALLNARGAGTDPLTGRVGSFARLVIVHAGRPHLRRTSRKNPAHGPERFRPAGRAFRKGPGGDGPVHCFLRYAEDLFNRETVGDITADLVSLPRPAVEAPDRRLSTIFTVLRRTRHDTSVRGHR